MSKPVQITPLGDVKKAAILSAVATLSDISLAADALGVAKTTLCRKLREYGVSPKNGPEARNKGGLKGGRKTANDPKQLALLIDHHLHTFPDLSLAKLEVLLRVGRHTIEAAVRNTRGQTFRQLRNRVMLEEATKLLRGQPQLSIKEVAGKLGYSSQSTLSRFLKTNSGQSSTKTRLNLKAP